MLYIIVVGAPVRSKLAENLYSECALNSVDQKRNRLHRQTPRLRVIEMFR